VRVHINGEEKDIAGDATIADLIAGLGLAGRRVAVELNRNVVAAAAWQTTRLGEHDIVEIVQFVGGG
jgi:thiamine biosynthesis protein ThiS